MKKKLSSAGFHRMHEHEFICFELSSNLWALQKQSFWPDKYFLLDFQMITTILQTQEDCFLDASGSLAFYLKPAKK